MGGAVARLPAAGGLGPCGLPPAGAPPVRGQQRRLLRPGLLCGELTSAFPGSVWSSEPPPSPPVAFSVTGQAWIPRRKVLCGHARGAAACGSAARELTFDWHWTACAGPPMRWSGVRSGWRQAGSFPHPTPVGLGLCPQRPAILAPIHHFPPCFQA